MSSVAGRGVEVPVIETERLRLRGPRPEDFADCAARRSADSRKSSERRTKGSRRFCLPGRSLAREKKDAGLPDKNRRDPHKTGESPALRRQRMGPPK